MKFPHKNKTGLSLVEALISVLLLSIIMLGGLRLYFTSDEILAASLHKKIATEMAHTTLETLKNSDYDTLADYVSTITIKGRDDMEGLSAQETVTVTTVDESGTTYKKVDVTVSWLEVDNNTQDQISLSTYMAAP